MDCHVETGRQRAIIVDGWVKAGLMNITGNPMVKQQTVQVKNANVQAVSCADTSNLFSHREGTVVEYILPRTLSQSTIDGRNGSTACTVISVLTAKAIVTQHMSLPPSGPPNQEMIDLFIDAMREGNFLYDESRRAKLAGLLAVYDVLNLWPQMGVKAMTGVDLGLRFDSFQEVMNPCLNQFLSLHGRSGAAAIYVACPFTICVVFQQDRMAVFDSHCHGTRGAMIALSDCLAGVDTLVAYLLNFLSRHFNVQWKECQLCFIETSL